VQSIPTNVCAAGQLCIVNRIIHHHHTPILFKASQNQKEALIYANNTGVMKPDFREPF
jgi:hypothetical protein